METSEVEINVQSERTWHEPALLGNTTLAKAEFSSLDENHNIPSRATVKTAFRKMQGGSSIAEVSQEDFEKFLAEKIKLCREGVSNYSTAKSNFDLRARQHLIQVAQIVHDERFSLEKVGKKLGKKISKSVRHNPYSLLIQMIDYERGSKIASKQGLALIYAIEKCEFDIARLATFFEKESIKHCYEAYKAQRKLVREDKPLKPPIKRLVLEGVPDGLTGEIAVNIRIHDGIAHFISLVD